MTNERGTRKCRPFLFPGIHIRKSALENRYFNKKSGHQIDFEASHQLMFLILKLYLDILAAGGRCDF